MLFVFRRPVHTARVLESLALNAELEHSELIVFCEGARNDREREAVAATRRLVREHARAGSVRIIERDQNLGCAASILAGINDVLATHDRIIVLEDDLVVSRFFLEYMNAALNRYAEDPSVLHVSGYMFPNDFAKSDTALVLPLTSSWGWGTWSRAWPNFDTTLKALPWLDASALRRFRFDVLGAFPYRAMLTQYQRGEIDAWDIRWYLGCFRASGKAIFPGRSLVANIGFDDTGTHATDQTFTESPEAIAERRIKVWPSSSRSLWRNLIGLSMVIARARSWKQRMRALASEILIRPLRLPKRAGAGEKP